MRRRRDRDRGALHYGSRATDPTGVSDCGTCGGEPLQARAGGTWACPHCTARQNARNAHHAARQARGEVRTTAQAAAALHTEITHNEIRANAHDN